MKAGSRNLTEQMTCYSVRDGSLKKRNGRGLGEKIRVKIKRRDLRSSQVYDRQGKDNRLTEFDELCCMTASGACDVANRVGEGTNKGGIHGYFLMRM